MEIDTLILGIMVALTEVAKAHTDDLERLADCLQKIDRSGKHLLSVVNDVLDISRIESGRFTLQVKPVSLRETLETAQDMIRTDLELKHLSMRLIAENLKSEYVYCDGGRLEQVLLNLLSNAVKYTPSGGAVEHFQTCGCAETDQNSGKVSQVSQLTLIL